MMAPRAGHQPQISAHEVFSLDAIQDRICSIERQRSPASVASETVAFARRLGADRIVIVNTSTADNARRWTAEVGCDFVRPYYTSTLSLRDALSAKIRTASTAFEWSEELWHDPAFKTPQEIIPILRNNRARSGYIVPYFGPAGMRGFVNFVRDERGELPPLQLFQLRAIAGRAFETSMSVIGQSVRQRTPMTRRQLQVLELSAAGLTASQISKKLQLATKTIEAYMLTAMLRLNASSKPSAVAQALREGLIN
jgi:DNA-binding CsgD family transcriptional regulator